MKLRHKVLLAVALLLILAVSIPFVMRWRAQARLDAYKKELLDSGATLAIEDIAPNPSSAEQKNGKAFLQAAKGMTPDYNFFPKIMEEVKPGRARVAWRQTELYQTVDPTTAARTNVWPLISAARASNEVIRARIREILSGGRVRFPLDYRAEDLSRSWIAAISPGRGLMLDATAEAILDLHEGRTDEAMENLLLALSTANILADEPLEGYQKARWRQLEVGRQACWEALQFKGWTDEQLAQYQKEWERMDLVSDASKCLAMDLAREAMAFRQIRISKPEFDTYFRPPDRDTGEITATVNSWMQKGVSYPRYWLWRGIWSYDDERVSMQLAQQIMQAMRKPVNTRLFRERLNQGGNDVDFSRCPVASMEREFRPEFVVGATGVLRTQTSVEMVIAAIALERYFIRFHKYPARLADLQPSFVAHVPIDYMDGAELRYRLRDDGSYLLYSVGHNGIDDGGDPNPVEKGMPLNFITARDWVWPAAATPEEVSAYEKGARKKAK